MPSPRLVLHLALSSFLAGCAPTLPRLAARAVLPAATFAEGPTSGQWIGQGPIHGQPVPFENRQPVQGFSSMIVEDDGTILALSDNGFGTVESSADYRLRVYRLRVDFETDRGGSGDVEVLGFFELSDPDGQIPFLIVNQTTDERLLTGADLDLESFRRAPDGTFWFGDELGPFLLHTDAEGRLLEPPIELPDPSGAGELRSPQSPWLEEGSVLRLMNAHRAHALAFGGVTPSLSPQDLLLDDGDDETGLEGRGASSEIVNVASLHRAGFRVVPWTVNEPERMRALLALGVDGLITDRPDLLYEVLEGWDPDGDGRPDLLDERGLIDRSRFDAQGHRGARGLRPENTLPAFEVALDHLVTTLETDLGVTSDRTPVLSHDPEVNLRRCRRRDGASSAVAPRIRDLSRDELRSAWICDGRLERFPDQRVDPALSPVAAVFVERAGLPDLHAFVDLETLVEFVDFYAEYYREGDGAEHPRAAARAANASQVRFNLEIKYDPTAPSRTLGRDVMVDAVLQAVTDLDIIERADIQSFDHAALHRVHRERPRLPTSFLIHDGTLRTDDDGRAPWLAGFPWPYRVTMADHPARVQTSGGLEGMALSSDGRRLLPMLEKPLVGDEPGTLRIFEYDLESGAFSERGWRVRLQDGATSIGDFLMLDDTRGLIIERDDEQANLDALKVITEVTLAPPGGVAATRTLVDLIRLDDPAEISLPATDGDVGLGRRFAFPFFTIECLAVLDAEHLLVANDNNYPFSVGRHAGSQRPDDNEIIVIELPEPLF